jgi:hypothetical protein
MHYIPNPIIIPVGLLIGILIAAPVGPVNVLCIQRAVERGFWGGIAAGIGSVMGDGLIALCAGLGVGTISGDRRRAGAGRLRIEALWHRAAHPCSIGRGCCNSEAQRFRLGYSADILLDHYQSGRGARSLRGVWRRQHVRRGALDNRCAVHGCSDCRWKHDLVDQFVEFDFTLQAPDRWQPVAADQSHSWKFAGRFRCCAALRGRLQGRTLLGRSVTDHAGQA